MDGQCSSDHNRTTGCRNPSIVSSNGGRNPPKPSKDQNQSLKVVGSSSGGRQGISSFPPTFSGDDPRPLQTDLFRQATLYFAHLGPKEEREQWASYLPENLRSGNIEKYLKEPDKPMLYGNKYWWLSKKNFAQGQPSSNQSSDHIRYSRVQLLELKEVMVVPESMLKIKQEIDIECLGVNQIAKSGGTNVGMIGAIEERRSALKKKREEKKGLISGSKTVMKKCRALINERKGKKKIAEKKKGAETIRKVGVRRGLKIQPLIKPKLVSHCRHYLKGRCNKGEKCRFSHDVQPLTKSLETPNQDPASTINVTKPERKASNPPPASDSIQRHSQKPHFVFGAHSQQSEISPAYNGSGSVMARNLNGNVPASKADQPVKVPKGLTFLNIGNSQKQEQPVPTSADVFVFGNNLPHDINKKSQLNLLPFGKHNKAAFGGGKKDTNAPSNPPDLPNPAGVFVFGKNSPHDHNKKSQPNMVPFGNHSKTAFGVGQKETNAPSNSPSLPNSAGIFVFGRNSPNDHNRKNQPSLQTFGNSSKTVFGADKKDTVVPFNPPTLPDSPTVFAFGKNSPLDHNKKNQPSLLPFGNNNKTAFGRGKKDTNAPSKSPVLSSFSVRLNALMKSTGPVGQSELIESRVNVHVSAGKNLANADVSKDGGASFKKPPNAAEVWEMLHGKGNIK